MKYTQIPATAFKDIQLNAGILVDDFDPSTGVIGALLGATSGGVQFQDAVEYKDFGEDIDNCPKNMLELKKLDKHEVTMSGTFVTINNVTAKTLAAVADVDPNNTSHIIPRNDVYQSDFKTLWWIGDYSDVNTGDNAGFCAIKMLNALNTGGFQIQTTDKEKGKFAFTFTGHYSMKEQDKVPYEVYIKSGSGSTTVPEVVLNKSNIALVVEETETLVGVTTPVGQTITWTSDDTDVASVSTDGVVTAIGAGTCTITATITVEGVEYTDICAVTVTAAA